MAKGNRKANEAEAKKAVAEQFSELTKIFIELKQGAEESSMPLLAKNIDLSIDIINAYRRAFLGLKIGDR